MSAYEKLPIFKAALDMNKYFELVVQGFKRYHKFTLGTELRDLARSVLFLVAAAVRKEQRISCLEAALTKLEHLKITIHLCTEANAFRSIKSVEHSIKLVVNLAKQCEGWLRSSRIALASSQGERADSTVTGRSLHRNQQPGMRMTGGGSREVSAAGGP